MIFNPNEKQELQPITAGKYKFKVIEAKEDYSKNNNEMIKLILEIGAGDRTVKIYDYLVNSPTSLSKVENFCQAVGLDFMSGELMPENCYRSGYALFKLGAKKEDGKQYLEVAKYLPSETPPIIEKAPMPTGEDIPF